MKSMTCRSYGGPEVLRLEELSVPAPGPGQILVKVAAAGLNVADLYTMLGDPYFLRIMMGSLSKPKWPILGFDLAGTVEAVGPGVEEFSVGDEVFGDVSEQKYEGGGYAEYAAVPAAVMVRKPANLSFAEAASIPLAAVTALRGLVDNGRIQSGQQVLVNGASGGVGSYAVQIAKAYGAEVTAVVSTGKVEAAKALGADRVVDYTKENFTENGNRYDLILAANGYHPLGAYKRVLNPSGTLVTSGGSVKQIFGTMLFGGVSALGTKKTLTGVSSHSSRPHLELVAKLAVEGKILPFIEKTYALEELPEAMAYLKTGHVKGKLVIVQ